VVNIFVSINPGATYYNETLGSLSVAALIKQEMGVGARERWCAWVVRKVES